MAANGVQVSNFHFRFSSSLGLTAQDAAAHPILRLTAGPFHAAVLQALQWFPGVVLLRWEPCRRFSCESPPAAVPHSRECPSADCSVHAAALPQNHLRLLRTFPLCLLLPAPVATAAGSSRALQRRHSPCAPQNPPRPPRSAPRVRPAFPPVRSPLPAREPSEAPRLPPWTTPSAPDRIPPPPHLPQEE